MIKQEKLPEPLELLRDALKAQNLYPDHPLSKTDGERGFYEVLLPQILKDQCEYLIKFVTPKLFWLDKIVFNNITWFALKKWRSKLFLIWFRDRVEFTPFEGIQEPFMTFESVRVYGKEYIIDLPLYGGHVPVGGNKDRIEDLDVKDGRYVPKDRNKPVN